jgi:hypothetical protein
VFLDRISWENFNESVDLKKQVEEFKRFTGFYPESIHVDRIYRTRSNRAWCQERGIRMSGPPLGRPPTNISKSTKKQAQSDERIRNSIEGKFGEAKRRFSLGKVMAKLSNTSGTAIAITFLVMNLSSLLRQAFLLFFCLFYNKNLCLGFLPLKMRNNYVLSKRNEDNLYFSDNSKFTHLSKGCFQTFSASPIMSDYLVFSREGMKL